MSAARLMMGVVRAASMRGARTSVGAVRLVVRQAPLRVTGAAPMPARALSTVQTFLDKAEVTERVLTVLKNQENVDAAKVTASSHFSADLGLDSLDAVEVCMALEDEFCITIPDAEAEKILSAEDAINFIATHPQAK